MTASEALQVEADPTVFQFGTSPEESMAPAAEAIDSDFSGQRLCGSWQS